MQVPQKSTELTCDPANPHQGIYPDKCMLQRDTDILMFIGALYNSWEHYTIAKTGKPPRCPSTGEWIKKMRYIYTTEYYSAKTSNETMLWKDLEFTKISEGSQKARNTI